MWLLSFLLMVWWMSFFFFLKKNIKFLFFSSIIFVFGIFFFILSYNILIWFYISRLMRKKLIQILYQTIVNVCVCVNRLVGYLLALRNQQQPKKMMWKNSSEHNASKLSNILFWFLIGTKKPQRNDPKMCMRALWEAHSYSKLIVCFRFCIYSVFSFLVYVWNDFVVAEVFNRTPQNLQNSVAKEFYAKKKF